MPYSAELAARLRGLCGRKRGWEEKAMFGGVVFMLRGNICVGVWYESLIARVGPSAYAGALAEQHVTPFDVTGRPMRGWVVVSPQGVASSEQLADWFDRARTFTATLVPK